MNKLSKLASSLALLTSVMGVGNVFAAGPTAGAVFQRAENTQSIELSNIEEDGAAQVPVVAAIPMSQSVGKDATVNKLPAKSPSKVAPTLVAKKGKTDGTEEADATEGDEENTTLQADADRRQGKDRGLDTASNRQSNGNSEMNAIGLGSGAFFSGGSGGAGNLQGGTTGTSGFAAGSSDTGAGQSSGAVNTSGNTVSNATGSNTSSGSGAGSGATASSGTGTGTGTGSGAGTTASSGNGATGAGSAGAPAPDITLGNKLEQYRNQMLQEVTSAQVTNPALTRRYQMVDKATYKSLGL